VDTGFVGDGGLCPSERCQDDCCSLSHDSIERAAARAVQGLAKENARPSACSR
jgi:hypothetical protein